MNIIHKISDKIKEIFQKHFGVEILVSQIKIEKTKKTFTGDFTINVFPFLRLTKKSPEDTATIVGEILKKEISEIKDYNVIKGFLNLSLTDEFWYHILDNEIIVRQQIKEKIVLEFSSPNTNKPLHLGHIRNNLLGDSLARILKRNGKQVIKVNLVNDRGIHICKSMLAWQRFGGGETPETSGKKGDKLVGDYYVLFDKKYREEQQSLQANGMDKETALQKSNLMADAREMLRKWELGDKAVYALWRKMNAWVYKGFDETYKKLGISFDKVYYESETYKNGKAIIDKGLEKSIFFKKQDGSVWIDLTKDGLDEKLLLRSDGTSVYITQDIGTFLIRDNEWQADKYMYVVGNEQEYHFKVLKLILKKLNYDADKIQHVSYGMVNLPHGKMKSREGTVVDADDLIAEMPEQAKIKANAAGKLHNLTELEKQETYRIIGIGALKYFILKVDAKKDILFNPEQSVDFEGNTAPFIQYSYARIRSLFRKASNQGIIPKLQTDNYELNEQERDILKWIFDYPYTITQAANTLNPAVVANYAYGIAKAFNQFYQANPILKNTELHIAAFRLQLSIKVGEVIKDALDLLGIEVPDRM